MFPAICFVHYPAIAKIVREEAAKFAANYASYRIPFAGYFHAVHKIHEGYGYS